MANDFENKPTAYDNALRKMLSGQEPTGASIPSYIAAADTLNTVNGNPSFLESAMDTASNIPKFIGVSLISGANQLYNIPTDIGNLFGADSERSNTADVVADFDSNWGDYYQQHQQGTDLLGFLISSSVPGMAGIKILNAGQASLRATFAGKSLGKGASMALNVLAPMPKAKFLKAVEEVATDSAAAGLLSNTALKAVTSGVTQSSLEVLAFESAIAITMFESPVLKNQTMGDFAINVAFGAGVFGLVGGTLNTVKLNSALKGALDEKALAARPFTSISEAAEASTDSAKMILDYSQKHATAESFRALSPADQTKFAADFQRKQQTLDNRIRTKFGALTKEDQDLATPLYQAFKGEAVQTQQGAFIGLEEVVRAGMPSKLATKAEKFKEDLAAGKLSIEEMDKYLKSALDPKDKLPELQVSFTKTYGEGRGIISPDAPTPTQLVDTLKKGQVIKVGPGGVTAGKQVYKFSLKKPYDIRTANKFKTNARYIWAQSLTKFKPTAIKPITISANDIPLMEKALKEVAEADYPNLKFTELAVGELPPINAAEMHNLLSTKKIELANDLLTVQVGKGKQKGVYNQEEIAAIANVKSSLLSGEQLESAGTKFNDRDLFAMQDHAATYTDMLRKNGEKIDADKTVAIWNIPQNVKLVYDVKPFMHEGAINNFVAENMVTIKAQQQLYQEGTRKMADAALSRYGKTHEQLPEINSGQVYSGALPSGAGSTMVGAAEGNYGTMASRVNQIGQVTSRMITESIEYRTALLEAAVIKLGNKPEAAIELSVLDSKIRSISTQFGLNEAGDAFRPLAHIKWERAAREATAAGKQVPKQPVIKAGVPDSIPIQNQETRDLIKLHIEVNGQGTRDLAGIRMSQGVPYSRDPEVYYPIPINPRDYPHFAMVTDSTITATNQHKTLYATSAADLSAQIKKLETDPRYTIRTKQEAEDYFKSQGRWDYEKTISANYFDTDAARKGVSAPFIVATDPKKITTDFMNWHRDRATGVVREAVAAKYEVQFAELRALGAEHTNIATSTFSSQNLQKFAEDAVKNPFNDYIKTALAIKKTSSYPWWVRPNKMIDEAYSRVMDKATSAVEAASTPQQLAEVNSMLTKAGYKGAAYDETMQIFANSGKAQGALTSLVQKANSILATVVLRLDSLNAANNAISANVLLGAETAAVVRAIGRGDAAAAGALAELAKIRVPGTGQLVMSPGKLIANSIKKFGTATPEMQWYKDHGFVTTISNQYKTTLEDLTFNPLHAGRWEAGINKAHAGIKEAVRIGEKWTGNRLAEEFNRFVAADVMKQMTDVAVKHGVMESREALAYINTFVNRTQGNYLASQRPMMFSGAVGQAIGLFQTYQFNLLQQLLRHVGEGHGKDAMTLLGLQGTIHGMNGLPAFNAINTHLVGTASGNSEHTDAYTSLYGAVGKDAGNWLMYGLASNMMLHPDLKVNLYTRGDINPRHITLVPVNPTEVPIYQATTKVFGNLYNTAKKLGAGGDVATTILQGIEHNGLSRPLAGLAQAMEGLVNPEAASYSTTKKGNIIAANDLFSLTNIPRILGGKPLDEAVALDAMFRNKSYSMYDSAKRDVLGQAIKTTMAAGQNPTQEQLRDFAQKYTEAGGKIDQYGSFIKSLYKGANESQINAMRERLDDPFARSMQTIMGGTEIKDFGDVGTAPNVPRTLGVNSDTVPE